MKESSYSIRATGFILISTLVGVLTGCTTYVERPTRRSAYVPPPPPVYVQPAEAPVFVIRTESDFYGPLSPYGVWVNVPGYGLCWKPAQVNPAWRPYANGHWEWTDTGWYWASDEPWGWATYHYGRWDLTAQFGWVWLPQTQWAPAWVAWRAGAGYVGWAPLPPSAKFASSGVVEVQSRAIAPQEYVFVQERNLLAPVGPQTVVVNNTTIINQTVHITSVKMEKHTVFNKGPRVKDIERVRGRKLRIVSVHELRHREETEAIAHRRNVRLADEHFVQSPPNQQSVPVRTVTQRELRRPENPKPVIQQPQPATRNDYHATGQQNSSFHYTVPQTRNPAQNKYQHKEAARQPEPAANPARFRQPQVRQEAKPAAETPHLATAPVQKRAEVRPQPQTRTARNRVETPQPTIRHRAAKKGAQVQVEKISEPLQRKVATNKQHRSKVVTGADRKQGKESNAPAGRNGRSQNHGRD